MPEEKRSMRSHWFDHVRKTRAKMSKGQKEKVLHRDAMKQASVSWAEVKAKIERSNKRKAKKKANEK